jgi:hypothetical protein
MGFGDDLDKFMEEKQQRFKESVQKSSYGNNQGEKQ